MEVYFLFPTWGVPLALTVFFFGLFLIWVFYLGEAKNMLTGVAALAFGWPIPLILSLISWVVHGVVT